MFPAPAGMNRATRRWPAQGLCVPRASGDEPINSQLLAENIEVFPAPAGMNRRRRRRRCSACGVPRASGDEPLYII